MIQARVLDSVYQQLIKRMGNQDNLEISQMLPAVKYLMEHFHEPITLEECAKTVQLSVGRFGHLFSELFGISPHKFLVSLRLDISRNLLVNSDMNINQIAEKVGFIDPCHFSRLFKKYNGITPKEYRKKEMKKLSQQGKK